MTEPYWMAMPAAAGPDVTDLCGSCGHVRDRHQQVVLPPCTVRGCPCAGAADWRRATFLGKP